METHLEQQHQGRWSPGPRQVCVSRHMPLPHPDLHSAGYILPDGDTGVPSPGTASKSLPKVHACFTKMLPKSGGASDKNTWVLSSEGSRKIFWKRVIRNVGKEAHKGSLACTRTTTPTAAGSPPDAVQVASRKAASGPGKPRASREPAAPSPPAPP